MSDRDQLVVALYQTDATLAFIADQADVCVKTVSNILRRHAVPPRGADRRCGPQHPLWRGGTHRVHGYVRMWISSDHPLRSMANRRGWILEHRLVMAEQLGRLLVKTETVHHRNGIRDDNRLENLQLWVGNHGHGSTYRCADCGSARLEAV